MVAYLKSLKPSITDFKGKHIKFAILNGKISGNKLSIAG